MLDKNIFSKKITSQAIVILLLASSFYLYEFIMQIAPGVIQEDLMRDFGIGATKFGMLSGFFYLSYTPLQLVCGLLLDRFSARLILTVVCVTFSLGVLLFAHAPNFYIAALARFIMGAGAACAFIGILHLTIRWVPLIHFAFFAGIAEMMGAAGGLGGTTPLALLLKHFDWRTTLTGFAYAGLILAGLIALFVRDNPANNSKLQIDPQKNTRSIWGDLKTVLHNRETWSISLYSFLIWAPVLAFSALWSTSFIRTVHNCDNVAAANAVAFVWLGIALTSPAIGWLSEKIGRRCIIMTISALIGAIALTIVLFVPAIPTYALYLLMFAIGIASSGQTLSFALIKDNNSPDTNGTANGFNNMAIVVTGLLFQPLIGKIMDTQWQGVIENGVRIYSTNSYQIALLILPICYFIAAITSIFFIKETRCITIWRNK